MLVVRFAVFIMKNRIQVKLFDGENLTRWMGYVIVFRIAVDGDVQNKFLAANVIVLLKNLEIN